MGASEDPQLLAVSCLGFRHLVEDSLLALPQHQPSTLVHASGLGLSVEGLVLQPLRAPYFLPKTLVRGTASRSCDFPFQVIVLAPRHELPSSVTNQTPIPTGLNIH